MRVGILTFRWAYNCGALLQAYALRRIIEKLGHSVEFINYIVRSQAWTWHDHLGLRGGEFWWYVPMRLRFDAFRHRSLPATRRLYTPADLRSVADRYDAIVVGSDQVWNSKLMEGYDPTFFLDFVADRECRKISYAACFGQEEQAPETMERAGVLLKQFDFISVRDEMSRQLVNSLSGRDAHKVLDPTLLCDFEDLVAGSPQSKPYIFVYNLSQYNRPLGEEVVRITREQLKLPVVAVWQALDFRAVDRRKRIAGPIRWLRLLKKAAFVCTNSFHGTALAVKYRKPMLCWAGSRTHRLADFLETCGLGDRLIGEQTGFAEIAARVHAPMLYGTIDSALSKQIETSTRFLQEALRA